MAQRIAVAVLLLLVTGACGESSSPGGISPSPGCAYSLSVGDSINGYPNGGTFPVAVTTTPPTGCSWNAVSNASWIHVTDGGSGSGNGTFTFTVDANTGPARTGTVTAAGRLITFVQAANASTPAPMPACAFMLSIAPTITGYPEGGTFTVGVTSTPSTGCSWTAMSHASWIHVTAGSSGSGSGAVTFIVDANPGDPRTATLTIAGETVTVNQSAHHG